MITHDDVVAAGAFALYKTEMGYRVSELEKASDPQTVIARDYEQFRPKYVRKFTAFIDSLEQQGLTITKAA